MKKKTAVHIILLYIFVNIIREKQVKFHNFLSIIFSEISKKTSEIIFWIFHILSVFAQVFFLFLFFINISEILKNIYFIINDFQFFIVLLIIFQFSNLRKSFLLRLDKINSYKKFVQKIYIISYHLNEIIILILFVLLLVYYKLIYSIFVLSLFFILNYFRNIKKWVRYVVYLSLLTFLLPYKENLVKFIKNNFEVDISLLVTATIIIITIEIFNRVIQKKYINNYDQKFYYLNLLEPNKYINYLISVKLPFDKILLPVFIVLSIKFKLLMDTDLTNFIIILFCYSNIDLRTKIKNKYLINTDLFAEYLFTLNKYENNLQIFLKQQLQRYIFISIKELYLLSLFGLFIFINSWTSLLLVLFGILISLIDFLILLLNLKLNSRIDVKNILLNSKQGITNVITIGFCFSSFVFTQIQLVNINYNLLLSFVILLCIIDVLVYFLCKLNINNFFITES